MKSHCKCRWMAVVAHPKPTNTTGFVQVLHIHIPFPQSQCMVYPHSTNEPVMWRNLPVSFFIYRLCVFHRTVCVFLLGLFLLLLLGLFVLLLGLFVFLLGLFFFLMSELVAILGRQLLLNGCRGFGSFEFISTTCFLSWGMHKWLLVQYIPLTQQTMTKNKLKIHPSPSIRSTILIRYSSSPRNRKNGTPRS